METIQCHQEGKKLRGNCFSKVKAVTLICGWLFGICLLGAVITTDFGRAELVERIVAVVNNDIVLLSELKEAISASKTPFASPEEQKAILNRLIDEKLTHQQISLLGIKVSESETIATIERIKEVNNLSEQTLLNMIALEGMTFEAFKKKIQNQLLQNRLVNQEVKSKVVITDQDVQTYYDAHKELYAGKVKYHIRQILLNVNLNSSENEKNQKYKNIRNLHDRLQKGESFSDLAQVYSQAPTASNGGDLGFFEFRLLAPQIRNALKDLEAGEFTDIIETDQGYQLFYVEEIQSAGGQTLEDVGAAIQDKLYTERMEEKFELWLAELRSKAHIRIVE